MAACSAGSSSSANAVGAAPCHQVLLADSDREFLIADRDPPRALKPAFRTGSETMVGRYVDRACRGRHATARSEPRPRHGFLGSRVFFAWKKQCSRGASLLESPLWGVIEKWSINPFVKT